MLCNLLKVIQLIGGGGEIKTQDWVVQALSTMGPGVDINMR